MLLLKELSFTNQTVPFALRERFEKGNKIKIKNKMHMQKNNLYIYMYIFLDMASLLDSFYVMFLSHDPNKAFIETNTPFKFTIVLPGKMLLDIKQWEVRLAEMFIPDYGFNIKHLRE